MPGTREYTRFEATAALEDGDGDARLGELQAATAPPNPLPTTSAS